MKNQIVALATLGVLAAATLTGCSGAASATFDGMVTVPGDMTLYDDLYDYMDEGDSCLGVDGYDDMEPGAQVKATADGNTVGISELLIGEVTDGACVFPFIIEVEEGHKFYDIEVARRGAIAYAEDELSDGIYLTLGDD